MKERMNINNKFQIKLASIIKILSINDIKS